MEGSIWEALRIASENRLDNLKIVLNANGWGAYGKVNLDSLLKRLEGFGFKVVNVDGHNLEEIEEALKIIETKQTLILFAKTEVEQFPFLKGQDAHYYVMNQEDIQLTREILK